MRIKLDETHIPYKWQKHCIENGLFSGVFLVFVTGKTSKTVKFKVKEIKKFVKSLQNIK